MYCTIVHTGCATRYGGSLSCPGTSGISKAVFMNSVSHGKVWTKNVASSSKNSVFSTSWMYGGYLGKRSAPPHPHPSLHLSIFPPFPCPLFPTHFPCQKLSPASVSQETPPHWGIEVFPFPPFPCPLFPTHVPCQKQSVASDSQESPPLLSLCVFPFPPPPFPLFPTHFPYFDYFPAHLSSLMISCCLYKLLRWQIMCELLSEQNSQTISSAEFVSHPPGSCIHFPCKVVSHFLAWVIFEWAPCQSSKQ